MSGWFLFGFFLVWFFLMHLICVMTWQLLFGIKHKMLPSQKKFILLFLFSSSFFMLYTKQILKYTSKCNMAVWQELLYPSQSFSAVTVHY